VARGARWRRYVGGEEARASVTTSAVRAGILVAGVILGAIIIANGFTPTSPSGAVPHPSASPTPSSPAASPTPRAHKLDCSSISGLRVAVENATTIQGLGAAAANRVKAPRYTVVNPPDVGTATVKTATSTVFYRTPADRKAARCVRKDIFPPATLKAMSAGGTSASPPFSHSTPVAIFVGSDYAAKHPLHG
jgi:hypothetical protein